MTTISLDFETRSVVDLRRCGVYVYAQHPQTDILCLGWAVDDLEPGLWVPGEPLPYALLYALGRDSELRAWNANFERVIWQHIGPRYQLPPIAMERWYCTMADASAMSLPRSLDACASVLRVREQKDTAAWRLVFRLSRPRAVVEGKPVWWTPERDPERFTRLYDYCKQDVRTERTIAKVTHRLGARERQIYLLDQRMNDAGVAVDRPLAAGMQRVVERGLDAANDEITAATAGAVTAVTKVADLTSWLEGQGLEIDGVRKSVVRELLEGGTTDPVRRALEARAEAGRSSAAKLDAIDHALNSDSRVRGMLFYYGANTGRWAGRLVQPQNFPRGDVPDAAQFLSALRTADYDWLNLFYPPLAIVASNLRGVFTATSGHVLRVGDFAQIEARVLAWLAGQTDLVELFRTGGKVYERMAARIYDVAPDVIVKGDPRRQIGKNTVLGCGYGLGWEKFQRTVKEQEGVVLDDTLAQSAVAAYREAYPRIPELWRALEMAALSAVEYPGKILDVRGLKITRRGSYLYIVLPTGRPLAYAAPKIEDVITPWNEVRAQVTCESLDNITRTWRRRKFYGGLWVENVVQAMARDLLADAMLRLDAAGHHLVLTVHDEIVADDDPASAPSLDAFLGVMSAAPAWAADCPIAVEGWEGERYRK